jgi:hypothetical protein
MEQTGRCSTRSNLAGGEMERRKETNFQRWCFRRKLDVLYYWSGLQLAVFNAYLYIRYIVKYHRRPRRRSREEAERVVKQVMEQYKEHNEQ